MPIIDTVPPESLIELSRWLGAPARDLAILAEGNASAKADGMSFWIKASGHSLQDLDASGLVRVASAPILAALDGPELDDAQIRELLETSTLEGPQGALPSVETFMHAFLLGMPGVEIVGHSHPSPLLSLLCTLDARELSTRRLFPDEVVCCGPAACYVDYFDPGLPLAKKLRERVRGYCDKFGEAPKTIWMQNHGLIATGHSASEVRSATAMQVKASRVMLGALQTRAELRFLSASEIERIHKRPD